MSETTVDGGVTAEVVVTSVGAIGRSGTGSSGLVVGTVLSRDGDPPGVSGPPIARELEVVGSVLEVGTFVPAVSAVVAGAAPTLPVSPRVASGELAGVETTTSDSARPRA